CHSAPADQFDAQHGATLAKLKAIRPVGASELNNGDNRCLLPLTLDELARAYAAHPQARLLAGGTDLALEVTQLHRSLPVMIALGQIAELKRIERFADRLEVGAAVTLVDIYQTLNAEYPD
ncbi:xanthine dehydrogenase small subunit, partial [Pseudomonas sp. FSL R10-0071]